MKKLMQWLLKKPVTWLANRVSSSPDKLQVFSSLSQLYQKIKDGQASSGVIVPFEMGSGKFIIFSDQHKGGRDAADDFRLAEKNYLAALIHYREQGFTFISLGDCEELWENTPAIVVEKNQADLLEEAKFIADNRYYRVFGNHDLEWKYDFPLSRFLKPLFGEKLSVYEGILLETKYNNKTYRIFLTHGHQGDKKSDGNPLSTWVVAALWTPIQRFLEVSINTTSDSFELVDTHNIIMYEWSNTQQDLIFVSGHTHKPVFASMDHIDRLNKQLERAKAGNDYDSVLALEKEIARRQFEYAGKQMVKTMARPSYFNSGCCCFSDGDITGIEIDQGYIRLVKWKEIRGVPQRQLLEQSLLSYIFDHL